MVPCSGTFWLTFAIAYKATGGIYLTGGVALALGEYLAQSTNILNSFIRNSEKDYVSWNKFLSNIPIQLPTDPHVAVNGALRMTQQLAKQT